MTQTIYEEKIAQLGIATVLKQELLAKYTTWKVGGPADFFVLPQTGKELSALLNVIQQEELPYVIIGRGSNLLVSDEGFKGIVIKLGEGFSGFEVKDHLVKAGGSHSIMRLATSISRLGLGGFEFAGGIPGSVGGAVCMNAGAHGSEISNVLKSTLICLKSGELLELKNKELGFLYRTSRLQGELLGAIVIEAVFELEKGDPESISANLNNFREYRQKTQPLQYPCAGSVFRNPEGNYAAKLIQEAGLGGYRIGGAEISTIHNNFIINRGDATAKDIKALIEYVRERIYQEYNIDLHPEVKFI